MARRHPWGVGAWVVPRAPSASRPGFQGGPQRPGLWEPRVTWPFPHAAPGAPPERGAVTGHHQASAQKAPSSAGFLRAGGGAAPPGAQKRSRDCDTTLPSPEGTGARPPALCSTRRRRLRAHLPLRNPQCPDTVPGICDLQKQHVVGGKGQLGCMRAAAKGQQTRPGAPERGQLALLPLAWPAVLAR